MFTNDMFRNSRFQRGGSTSARGRREGGEEKAQHYFLAMSSVTYRLRLLTDYLLPLGHWSANCRGGRQPKYTCTWIVPTACR
jgi:hypothetical protein